MIHPKRPRDPNQLAKSIIDIATGKPTTAPFHLPKGPGVGPRVAQAVQLAHPGTAGGSLQAGRSSSLEAQRRLGGFVCCFQLSQVH
jgi:hypothetical protein